MYDSLRILYLVDSDRHTVFRTHLLEAVNREPNIGCRGMIIDMNCVQQSINFLAKCIGLDHYVYVM